MYEPEHLERWTEKINYEGENFDDYYVASWRLFRCSPVERSNFAYIKEQLKGCYVRPREALDSGKLVFATFTDEVYFVRYYLLVHRDETRALKMADMLAARIERKGSLDPDSEKALDIKTARQSWKQYTVFARMQVCREAGISIFAARRGTLPDNDTGRKLLSLMREEESNV